MHLQKNNNLIITCDIYYTRAEVNISMSFVTCDRSSSVRTEGRFGDDS